MTPARAHVLAQRAGLCDQRKAFSVPKHARTHARTHALPCFICKHDDDEPPACRERSPPWRRRAAAAARCAHTHVVRSTRILTAAAEPAPDERANATRREGDNPSGKTSQRDARLHKCHECVSLGLAARPGPPAARTRVTLASPPLTSCSALHRAACAIERHSAASTALLRPFCDRRRRRRRHRPPWSAPPGSGSPCLPTRMHHWSAH